MSNANIQAVYDANLTAEKNLRALLAEAERDYTQEVEWRDFLKYIGSSSELIAEADAEIDRIASTLQKLEELILKNDEVFCELHRLQRRMR